MDRKGVAAAAGVCLIAGIVVIALYVAAMAAASAGDDWTQKAGTIEKDAPLTYRYDTGGQTYRSTRVTFGDAAVNEARAKALGYQAGQRVLVYVNPSNPSEAVLELGRRPTGWVQPLAGGLLLLTAAALAFYLFMPQKNAPAPGGMGDTTLSRRTSSASRNGETTLSRRTSPGARNGNTTATRRPPPMSRLKPPPAVKRKAPEDEPTM